MKKQKKFNKKVGGYDGVDGITEYESVHLPNPQQGPKVLEPGFDTIWNYDILTPLVNQARIDFRNDLNDSIKKKEIEKINSGLADYVRSSRNFSYNLDLLKASILNAYGEDLVTSQYDTSAEEIKQAIRLDYFENVEELNSIKKCWLIKPKAIKKYKKLAIKYTCEVLAEYIRTTDSLESDIYDLLVYRGQGHTKYYKNDSAENMMDTISAYTGIHDDAFPYFERQLLSSYCINSRVAETFMVHQNNQRRCLLTAEFTAILPNLFSSFIVSDIFVEGQYELLCIPNSNEIFIREDVNDIKSAEFSLSQSRTTTERLVRKPLKE